MPEFPSPHYPTNPYHTYQVIQHNTQYTQSQQKIKMISRTEVSPGGSPGAARRCL